MLVQDFDARNAGSMLSKRLGSHINCLQRSCGRVRWRVRPEEPRRQALDEAVATPNCPTQVSAPNSMCLHVQM